MVIKLRCRSCFAKVSADDDLIGREVNCPNCNFLFKLPQPQFGFGKVLGGYEIEQWLGAGAMGEVYLARQVSMNRPVALKVIKHDINTDREVVDRFIKEAHILASLNHTSIVPAYDAGTTDDCYYMAMGYIDGETLEDKMKRTGKMDEVEALKICIKVTEALEYAWTEFKLLHRDIKPANIMIDAMNEIKIMDMGIAKNTNDDGGLTQAGLVVGTPFYMSPEQAQASTGIDFRSDIYALAATLYHLLTGTLPFQGPNVMAILAKKVNYPLSPPNEVNPDISKETSDLIVNLLNYNPDLRLSSFEEIKSAFHKCISAARKHKKGLSDNSTKTRHMAVPDKLLEYKSRTKMKKADKPAKKDNKVKVIAGLGGFCLVLLVLLMLTGGNKKPTGKEGDSAADVKGKTGEIKNAKVESPVKKPRKPQKVKTAAKMNIDSFLKTYQAFSWNFAKKADREKLLSNGAASFGKFGELHLREGCFYLKPGYQKEVNTIRKAKSFTVLLNYGTRYPRIPKGTILTLGADINQSFSISSVKGNLILSWYNPLGQKIEASAGAVPAMSRLAVTYQENTLKIYDGADLKKKIKDVSIDPSKWKFTTLVLGSNVVVPDLDEDEPTYWQGRIFIVSLFREAMTEKQLKNLMEKYKRKR